MHEPIATSPPPTRVRPLDWPGLASAAVLAVGLIAAYDRTFTVPLLFDDDSSILTNASIRRLAQFESVLFPPKTALVGGRPVLNLSLALNYHFGGVGVQGYHWVNWTIHLLAAWTLFALVRRTLRMPVLAARFGAASNGLALAVSAIWAWHPVQTESVTYISQRAESLAGLFYLLTLYVVARVAPAAARPGAGKPNALYLLAVTGCALGMATKEIVVTAPAAVLLYDRTFISGSFRAALRRRWPLYAGLAATWLLLACLMTGLSQRNIGLGHGISAWHYGLMECRAVVRYLGLSVWPHPLVFDYGKNLPAAPWAALGYALVLLGLVGAAVGLCLRRRPAGFAAVWFFLLLAPTSSVIPVVGQPMAENRLYLPLAGVVALAVLGLFVWLGRASWAILGLLACGLDFAAAERNRDYASALSLWSDTVAKNPGNDRAQIALGASLGSEGRWEEAAAHYSEALRIDPNSAEAHNDLGNAEEKLPGRLADAVREYEAAVRLKPDYYAFRYNLGVTLAKVPGRESEAMEQFRAALRLRPDFGPPHEELGNLLFLHGEVREAVAELTAAVRFDPANEGDRYNLGNALRRLAGGEDEAIAQYQIALRLDPNDAEARNNLGNALRAVGRRDEAIEQYREALRLKPDFVAARRNLDAALSPP